MIEDIERTEVNQIAQDFDIDGPNDTKKKTSPPQLPDKQNIDELRARAQQDMEEEAQNGESNYGEEK